MEENKEHSPSPGDPQQQEQPLNTSSSNETIASSEAIAEVEQPRPTEPSGRASTLNLSTEALAKADLKPSTLENMEVHHHSHESHGKKNWKSYFWEFLMLFLAVFCGFLAEYQLEHKIEKDREKVYMKNMLEDLKSDTMAYKKYARDKVFVYDVIDSLVYLLKNPERKKHTGRIYFLARILTIRTDLLYTYERTYDQMKSSGLLRLIHNQKVSDSVSSYYNSLKQISEQNNRLSARIDQYFLSMGKLFDAEILLKIFKEKKAPENSSIKLLTEDPLVINELLTRAQYLYGTISLAQSWGLERCRSAERLIELVKNEYRFE